MKSCTLWLVILCSLWIVLPATAQETAIECTYYLQPKGNNNGTGTESQPWRTLSYAAEVTQPGDTSCLLPGAYLESEGVSFTNSGTAEQPITFAAPQGDVTIQGSLEFAEGTSHLRLYGLTLRDFEDWGVSLSGGNTDIVLSGLNISGGEAGIHLTYGDSGAPPQGGLVDAITIEDSVITDSMFTAVDCTPGPCNNIQLLRLKIAGMGLMEDASYGADGIAIERGQNILIEGCYIHDIGGDGIDLNSRDVGSSVENIMVRRNRVENNLLDGIKLWVAGEMSNNLVWHSGAAGLVLMDGGQYAVINNTIASPLAYGYMVMLGDYETTTPTKITLYNNIFYNDNPEMGGTLIYVAAGTTLIADHNLYYNPYRDEDVICPASMDDLCFGHTEINDGIWFAQTGYGEHSLAVDPLFVDAANGDFHLSVNSPLIDAGQPVEEFLTDDLDGHPRDVMPDIGAYEVR